MNSPQMLRLRMATNVRHRGFTLVELLVALAIGLVIVLAAVGALTASRMGASAVDGASQLRDNGRFASDLIQRLAVQAGFEDLAYSTVSYAGTASSYKFKNNLDIKTLQPNVFGFNNAKASASDPTNRSTPRSASDGMHGSDVLVLQYQTVKSVLNTVTSDSDGSMINCLGVAPSDAPIDRKDRQYSVLSVYTTPEEAEPRLGCIALKADNSGEPDTIQPLIKGVESFQVLYGVDNVTPGAALGLGNAADSVADRFLRADQLTVSGNENATYANWRRVRSIRIGMVLRGAPGSAPTITTQKLYPLGSANMASDSDVGSSYTVTDSRLRQVVTFTVQLRNCQNQGFQPPTSTLPCDVTLPG